MSLGPGTSPFRPLLRCSLIAIREIEELKGLLPLNRHKHDERPNDYEHLLPLVCRQPGTESFRTVWGKFFSRH
jgi:hypothetical protein